MIFYFFNSFQIFFFATKFIHNLQGSSKFIQWVNFQRLPIPVASGADRSAISKRVQKCLDAQGVECEEREREIDERVAALYGLTPKEAAVRE